MVLDRLALEGELALAEVGIVLRIVAHDGTRQDGNVAGAGQLALIGQARRIGEVAIDHA